MNTCLRKASIFLAVQEGLEGMKDAVHSQVCREGGQGHSVSGLQYWGTGPLSVREAQCGDTNKQPGEEHMPT